eukprot:4765473-Prymnesium_polylepis.1
MPIASVIALSWALMMCCAACAAGMRCGWYVVRRCRRGERAVSAGRRAAGGAGSGRAGGGSWPGP